jgi:glutaredoxin
MMKGWIAVLLALACSSQAWAAAEYFRWIDEKGRVVYSDQTPPPNARNVQILKRSGARVNLEAPEAAKGKAEVILFTANCGATCDQAQEFLSKRGVSFSLQDANKNAAAAEELKKRTGALEVPVLVVGDSMQRGYSPSVWEKMLEVAGYKTPAKEKPAEETASPEQAKP